MIDTLATAQALTKAGIERSQAEAITTAVNQLSEQVTRSDISALELRLIKWGIALAVSLAVGIVGLQTALVFGIVRFFH